MITTINEWRKFNESVTYYNSHGETMKFSEFIEIEVQDRENYPMEDVEEWMQKYGISMSDDCIWVTKDIDVARSYHYDYDHENAENNSELGVSEINGDSGFIIEESEDGDDKYLFIYKNTNEGKQTQMFNTDINDDDVKAFRKLFTQYINNGLNIPVIKNDGVLDKLTLSDCNGGLVIDYSHMNDGSSVGLLYDKVYKKLNPTTSFKCMGWKNYTKASLEHIITFMFKKTFPQYNKLVIDKLTMMDSDKMIITIK